MCGVTGWARYDRDVHIEVSTLERMTDTMACRGPDAAGIYVRQHVGLGHRRLAIIDIAGGAQPMVTSTAAGEVALVYSGEVYNHVELREELLAAGHRFDTRSDTEVVLRGYLEWGLTIADRLNGMFAFALWDGRTDRLVLVRDRMGVKPLYYCRTEEGLLFGSEPKAILAQGSAPRRITLDGLRELYGFVKTPGHAVWDGMREVVPGTMVVYDRSGLSTRTYWELVTEPHCDTLETTITHVRELLEDSVGRQLVADVPQGVLLSGGLDSSAVTAIAALQLSRSGGRVRSFSVDLSGRTDRNEDQDDTSFAHEVVMKSATDHTDIALDAALLGAGASRLAVLRARDMPASMGDMDASLYLLFKAIAGHVTVALSGEAADEVFGGYRQFFSPVAWRAPVFPWIVDFVSRRPRSSRSDLGSMFAEPVRSRLDLAGYVQQAYADAIAPIQRLDGESGREWQMRKIFYLHLTRFVRILLDRKDRMSMATGLEVRVPYCDHRLVSYVYNTPWSMKSFDGREKSLLRAATQDILPKSVLERAKSPYPSTQDQRYIDQLCRHARGLLANPSDPVFSVISEDWLRGVVQTPEAEMGQSSRRFLERALDLALWLDLYKPQLALD